MKVLLIAKYSKNSRRRRRRRRRQCFFQKYLGSWTHRDLAGAKTLKTVKKKNQNEYNNDRQPFRIQEQLNRNFDNSAAPVFELEPKYFEIKYKNTNKTVLVWKNPEQILLQFNGKKRQTNINRVFNENLLKCQYNVWTFKQRNEKKIL